MTTFANPYCTPAQIAESRIYYGPREVSDELGRIARTIGPFGLLSIGHSPRPGAMATASLRDGARTYYSARGRTPARACALLLSRLSVSTVAS